jgi:hypothetical protein
MNMANGIISKADRIAGLVPIQGQSKMGKSEKTFRDGTTYNALANQVQTDMLLGEESKGIWLSAPEHFTPGVGGDGNLQSLAIRVRNALKSKKRGLFQLDGKEGRPSLTVQQYPGGTMLDGAGEVMEFDLLYVYATGMADEVVAD